MKQQEYKLHSRGHNWFHFRIDLNSMLESFTVTYTQDGTVCMTGDMGCLSWQRGWFPDGPDYGFPFKETGIGYFAEKVVRAEECQKIKDWKADQAKIEMNKTLQTLYQEEGNEQNINTLQEIIEELDSLESGEYGYYQMVELFNTNKHDIESETWTEYGRNYTDGFRRRFEMLQSVSDLILESVKLNKIFFVANTPAPNSYKIHQDPLEIRKQIQDAGKDFYEELGRTNEYLQWTAGEFMSGNEEHIKRLIIEHMPLTIGAETILNKGFTYNQIEYLKELNKQLLKSKNAIGELDDIKDKLNNNNKIISYRMQVCSRCKKDQDNENCFGSDQDIETCMDAAYEAIHQHDHIPR